MPSLQKVLLDGAGLDSLALRRVSMTCSIIMQLNILNAFNSATFGLILAFLQSGLHRFQSGANELGSSGPRTC